MCLKFTLRKHTQVRLPSVFAVVIKSELNMFDKQISLSVMHINTTPPALVLTEAEVRRAATNSSRSPCVNSVVHDLPVWDIPQVLSFVPELGCDRSQMLFDSATETTSSSGH